MAAAKSVKARGSRCRIVGVITTGAELRLASRMPDPPDFFELRLDHLAAIADRLERQLSPLRAPLIITARHPAEGGANNLPFQERRDLLARFLEKSRYVDVELRSIAAYQTLLHRARRQGVGSIISFHDFALTPSPRSLHAKAAAAKSAGAAIFKVATRTDTPAQLARLFEFCSGETDHLALSVMGVGKLGAISRVIFATSGSVLTYGSIAQKRVEGQLSVAQLRTAFDLFEIR